jgi:hydrogenase expression/formation protein HypC
MCLAVPVKIEEITGPNTAVGVMSGVRRTIDISLLENPQVGEYVLLHAGFAIERIDEAEARRTLELFRDIAAQEDET